MAWTLWDQGHPGIFIEDTPAGFFAGASADLNLLRSRPLGADLLKLLSKRAQGIGTTVGKYVRIRYTANWQDTGQDSSTGGQEVRAAVQPGGIVRLPAVGDSSVVLYSHSLDYTAALGASLGGITMPNHIALGHELIHALHVISGDVVKEYSNLTDGAIIEEARTVGLGPYEKTRISENALRKEWGLLRRNFYNSPGDTDGLTAVT